MPSSYVLVLALLAGPFTPPEKLPPLPPNPVIKFLNEDIWKLYGAAKQCVQAENKKLCVDMRNDSIKPEDVNVSVMFTWRF